ncbi:hypothetical protein [Woeseia oceani]|nr:hypothetical protein [Woeseia oceani]
MAQSFSGHRPCEWWKYESPEPLRGNETLQLYRMGELSGEELRAVTKRWAEHEERIAQLQWYVTGHENNQAVGLDGHEGYLAWRRFYGIPDELFPPRSDKELIALRQMRRKSTNDS